ncbi:MAG: sodium-dependent transporter [Chlamydiia bacterium]|nr:sodium-dependent transporter [Chlamydiia bacterium]
MATHKREQWKSRFGFIWAAVGSAIGLGSIWRFPYVVGENGGATFVILYLICLLLVGLPVLISEILIGRKAQLNPSGSFLQIGKHKGWQGVGKMTILTGFLVSSFYAVIAGWTLGYFFQSVFGEITHFSTAKEATKHFQEFSTSPLWGIGSLIGFLFLSFIILYTGVQKGIEAGNKIMMPLLLFVLIFLAVKGLLMPGAGAGVSFVFQPNWSEITPTAILLALGQAFFSLSLGQGTMITYGSYLGKKENIPGTCVPITLFGICISLLAGIAIFSIVFSAGLSPSAGESLMFQTLPIIFSQIPGGYLLCLLFFLLLVLAALTSQISAMEPLIAYFIDNWKWKRHRAVLTTTLAVFIVALPCVLSFGPWKDYTLFGKNFFNLLLYLCLNILIPLGGLAAVIMVGWRWTFRRAFPHLQEGAERLFKNYPPLKWYFGISIRYVAPLIIVIVMLDALGVF